MKKIFPIILVLSSWVNCFSQNITDQEYERLARLFAQDVQYNKILTDIPSSKRLKSNVSFTYSTILELYENLSVITGINKILIIVDSSIYSQVQIKINRYATDINEVYGCEVIMEQVSRANYEDIKNLINSELIGLDGVVLIGNIPAAWYEVANDHGSYGYAAWPCDLYYMDTDGIWEDLDNNEIFDSHSGNVQPEIFVGRISTANMGTLLSEKTGLENYLDKNHEFWIGKLIVNRKYGLTYTDEDWAQTDYFKTDIQYLYGSAYYDSISYIGYPSFGRADYLNRLSNNRYEFIQLACHSPSGAVNCHAMTGGSIYANEIFNNGTEAIGYNLFCCSGCRWTSVSPTSTRGFLGGLIYTVIILQV